MRYTSSSQATANLYTPSFTDATNMSSFESLNNRKVNRVRQLYENISMLFLFPVKDGKLSTGVNATFNESCYG